MASPSLSVDRLERLGIEVGLGALSVRVSTVDLVAPLIDLDAVDLPSRTFELLAQRLLGLPFGLRTEHMSPANAVPLTNRARSVACKRIRLMNYLHRLVVDGQRDKGGA